MAAFPYLRKLYLVVYNIQSTVKVWNREKLYLVGRHTFIICCEQNDSLFGKECSTHVSMACRVNRQWALNVGIAAYWGRCCLRNNPLCEVVFLVRFSSLLCRKFVDCMASKVDFYFPLCLLCKITLCNRAVARVLWVCGKYGCDLHVRVCSL